MMKRLMIAALCALPLGCTIPKSSGISLWELTKQTTADINEFSQWVEADLKPGRNPFPAGLCLASVTLHVTLSDVTAKGGGVTVPLAAPSAGLSGALGYNFTNTRTEEDTIEIPFEPVYREPDTAIKTKKDGRLALTKFLTENPALLNPDETPEKPNLPPQLGNEDHSNFDERSDLAAELWRIREAIHYMVRASGKGDVGYQLLRPKDMTFKRTFKVVRFDKKTVKIVVAGAGSGDFGSEGTETSQNIVEIKYRTNHSNDQLKCDRTSLIEPKA